MLGGKKFYFSGSVYFRFCLRYWMWIFGFGFLLGFSGSGFGSFRWIFGLFFGFQGLRILVFLRMDSVISSDLDLFCC